MQDELRESGCLMRLQSLLAGSGRDVRLAAVAAAANLALNTGNMKEMEYYVPLLASIAEDESRESDKELLVQALLALTNIAVLPDWHHQYRVLLPRYTESLRHRSQYISHCLVQVGQCFACFIGSIKSWARVQVVKCLAGHGRIIVNVLDYGVM